MCVPDGIIGHINAKIIKYPIIQYINTNRLFESSVIETISLQNIK